MIGFGEINRVIQPVIAEIQLWANNRDLQQSVTAFNLLDMQLPVVFSVLPSYNLKRHMASTNDQKFGL